MLLPAGYNLRAFATGASRECWINFNFHNIGNLDSDLQNRSARSLSRLAQKRKQSECLQLATSLSKTTAILQIINYLFGRF